MTFSLKNNGKIRYTNHKKYCYLAFARLEPDFDIKKCDDLGQEYEDCYLAVAINKNDSEICEELTSSKRLNCIQKTIGDNYLQCTYIIAEHKNATINKQRDCLSGLYPNGFIGLKVNEEMCDEFATILGNNSNNIVVECYNKVK